MMLPVVLTTLLRFEPWIAWHSLMTIKPEGLAMMMKEGGRSMLMTLRMSHRPRQEPL